MSEKKMSSSCLQLLDYIGRAGDSELSAIVLNVINRYAVLFPDTEVIFVSLPKNNPEEREETLKQLLRMTAIVFPSDS